MDEMAERGHSNEAPAFEQEGQAGDERGPGDLVKSNKFPDVGDGGGPMDLHDVFTSEGDHAGGWLSCQNHDAKAFLPKPWCKTGSCFS